MRIRSARLDDAEAMGQVFVDTYHVAHRGQVPDWLLETRTYEVSTNGWARTIRENAPGTHLQVAELDGAIVGIAMGGPPGPWPFDDAERERRRTGECYALYIDTSKQGSGIGRALLRDLADRLAAGGTERLIIGVLAANAPARAFYERMGGKLLGERDFDDEGVQLAETVYVWDDLRTLLSSATDGSR
jgi:ribosomal protein S18 acetylase RimI-like enzyme